MSIAMEHYDEDNSVEDVRVIWDPRQARCNPHRALLVSFINLARHPFWKLRYAAALTFGRVLEIPVLCNPSVVERAMPTLIELMSDENVAVRCTVARTIGRVFKLFPEVAANETHISSLMPAFFKGLDAEPRVASNVCLAIGILAKAAFKATVRSSEDHEPRDYSLAEYFEEMVLNLYDVTYRNDGNEENLRNRAYYALKRLAKYNAGYGHVLMVVREMSRADTPYLSDEVVGGLLQKFDSVESAYESDNDLEDGALYISFIAQDMGEDFLKYMDDLMPFLTVALQNRSRYEVCYVALELTHIICHALNQQIIPYCGDIIRLLLENFCDLTVPLLLTPLILFVLHYIASVIGPCFVNYFVSVSTILPAFKGKDMNDYTMIDVLYELRVYCLQTFSIIIIGLEVNQCSNDTFELAEQQVPNIISLISCIARDTGRTDDTINASAEVLGFMCSIFGQDVLCYVDDTTIHGLLTEGTRSTKSETVDLAVWAMEKIRLLKNADSS